MQDDDKEFGCGDDQTEVRDNEPDIRPRRRNRVRWLATAFGALALAPLFAVVTFRRGEPIAFAVTEHVVVGADPMTYRVLILRDGRTVTDLGQPVSGLLDWDVVGLPTSIESAPTSAFICVRTPDLLVVCVLLSIVAWFTDRSAARRRANHPPQEPAH